MKISSTQRPERRPSTPVQLSSNKKSQAGPPTDSFQKSTGSTLSNLLVPTRRKVGSAAIGGLGMAAVVGGGCVVGQLTNPLVGSAIMAAGLAGGAALSASKNNGNAKMSALAGGVTGLQMGNLLLKGDLSPLGPVAAWAGVAALAGYAKPNLFLPRETLTTENGLQVRLAD